MLEGLTDVQDTKFAGGLDTRVNGQQPVPTGTGSIAAVLFLKRRIPPKGKKYPREQ
jgi:hypothetical protein